MDTAAVKSTGIPELVKALHRVSDDLGNLSVPGQQIGAELVKTAVEFAPVLSGALVADIRAQADDDGVMVVAGETVPYVAVQNYGWPGRNIVARRFMDQAEDRAEDVAADEIGSYVDRVILVAGLS